MVERAKKRRKGTISEEDVSTLFQRYNMTTVLQLLQEVAHVPGVRIDWNALVKKTTTGISNAREYQMLWRHLAYRDALLQRLEDEAKPVDDDSDLDYELEAFPSVSSEASAEAAACVKVLIASGSQNDTSLPNGSTVEAPLTINIPNGLSSRAPSDNRQPASLMQGTNITVPVSVQKQPLPTVTSAEGLDVNGSASGTLPARRKRKPWSAAEDMELIAAVQKCGEGNWANILKGDFKGDRTASQLSQRWAIIRKRKGNLNVGGGSSQLSEAQLAARRAVSLALDGVGDNLKAACTNAGMNSNTTACNSGHPTVPDTSGSVPTTAQGMGISVPSMKFRLTTKKTPTKSALSPDPMVKAAAVAAGARIATPSDAASLLKAAQAKNAVRIMPGSGSLIKPSSTTGNPNPLPGIHLGAHPNVHYMRTGPTGPPNASRIGGTQQVQGQSVEPAVATVQNSTSVSPEVTKAVSSSVAVEGEAKTSEDDIILDSSNAAKEQVQEDQGFVSREEPPSEQSQEDQGNAPKDQVEEHQASISGNAPNDTIQKCQTELVGDLEFSAAETGGNEQAVVIGNQAATENETVPDCKLMVEEGLEDPVGVDEMCVDQNVNGKQDDLIDMVMDGSDDKVEVLSKAPARPETEGDKHVRLA